MMPLGNDAASLLLKTITNLQILHDFAKKATCRCGTSFPFVQFALRVRFLWFPLGGGGWGGGSLRLFAVVVIEAVANDLLEILRIAKTYTFHSNQTLSRLRDVFMKIIKSTIPVKVD